MQNCSKTYYNLPVNSIICVLTNKCVYVVKCVKIFKEEGFPSVYQVPE